jgi:CRISPR-associated protein Csx17
MRYLKALGVFRLVAEQKDSAVRACWRHDTFVLHTSLDPNALVRFFLEEYSPTPIVAPWNGGSGFYEKDNKQAMNAILTAEDPRLDGYRGIIQQTQQLAAARGSTRSKDSKQQVLAECRNVFPDEVLPWLDAAYVLSSDGPKYPPLLGTGGNDGRLEFSNNFMQNLVSALGLEDRAEGRRSRKRGSGSAQGPRELIDAALFGETSPSLIKDRTTGQFSPGTVGGPNATVGFEAESLTNPWDYVLMIEGALFFAGAVARRLSPESRTKAIFPFTVDTSAAGYGTAVDAEYSEASRSELWAPLWDQPATYPEVAHVFAEGRAQLGPRQAATGADFARAVAGLGVERGISEFVRFGFLRRSGLAYLATPLGRFKVKANPQADVLLDIDWWLTSLRNLARRQDAPEALKRHLRQIDQTIIALCQVRQGQGDQQVAQRLQDVLIALGRVESWLGRSRFREWARPLSGLRPDWLTQADDGSPEFRVAAAIASIQGSRNGAIGSLRVNLEPVKFRQGWWQWDERNPSEVWQGSDLLRDMAAVLERRCLEARMRDDDETALPLQGKLSAPLGNVLDFLEGRLDDRRISDLVLPLTAVRWHDVSGEAWATEERRREELLLPLPYATLKLVFLPWKVRPYPGADTGVRPEPSLLPLLRAGRASEAYIAACRRLYVSGLIPLVKAGLDPLVKAPVVPPYLARRLAAALLIPISQRDMYVLADIALAPNQENP